MWQLGLLSALMLMSSYHAARRWSYDDLKPVDFGKMRELNLTATQYLNLLNDVEIEEESFESLTCGDRHWPDPATFGNNGWTYLNEAPWLVNILLGGGMDRCDGSLIHPQVVLTAAHCVANERANSMTVFAGQWHPRYTSAFTQQQDVDKIIIHEKFKPENRQKNFAILILRRRFRLTETVGVLCLLGLRPGVFQANVLVGGWHIPNDPTKGEMYLVNDHEKCRRRLDQSGLNNVPLLPNIQCIQVEPLPLMCEETYGSPIVEALSPYSRHYYLLGVLSWNPYCNSTGGPTLYSVPRDTDKDWIEATLQRNNIEF